MSCVGQSSWEILMVRPKHFGFDPETAATNVFQVLPEDDERVRREAVAEFDAALHKIRAHGVKVNVFEDRDEHVCPDAVFPNNWFSTHKDGTVFLYPMLSTSRRSERRQDVIDFMRHNHVVNAVVDLSPHEVRGVILEGTGSLVFDHMSKRVFASRSARTEEKLVEYVAKHLGYEWFVFDAHDQDGQSIYHTNVMMWVGSRAAGVALDAIVAKEDRERIVELLGLEGRRTIFDLSHKQIGNFAGNCIEVANEKEEIFLVMSLNAAKSFESKELERLRACFNDLIVCDVGIIEEVGGGSIRCMIAELNLPREQQ